MVAMYMQAQEAGAEERTARALMADALEGQKQTLQDLKAVR